MKELKNIVGINLVIFLIYTVLSRIPFIQNVLPLLGLAFIFHFIIVLFASIIFFIDGNIKYGKAFLLSAGLLLLIGFSTCALFY